MAEYKELIEGVLGAAIAVVWVAYGILGPANFVFLVVAIAISIMFGTLLGGLQGMDRKKNNYKDVIGWLFGAAIAVVWVAYGILGPGNMVFLVVAISITIVFGALSGGFITLGRRSANPPEAPEATSPNAPEVPGTAT